MDTPAVSLIDVSGVAGVAGERLDEDDNPIWNSGINVNVWGADFAGAVSVLIGESDVWYNTSATNEVRETFTFSGDGTGTVSISGFNASVGATGDRLDFSQLDGIGSLDDLLVEFDGFSTEVSSVVDGVDVDITLVGVNIADDPLYFEFG